MTTVAWDGTTLAADKQTTSSYIRGKGTKVYRIKMIDETHPYHEAIVACWGVYDHLPELLNWFEVESADPAKYPTFQKDENESICILMITKLREILTFTSSAYPSRREDQFVAYGSGREFALAAMHLGHCARVAIEVASYFDIYTGNGIDTLTLD